MHASNFTNGTLTVFPANKDSSRESISLLKEHPHDHEQNVGIQTAKAILERFQMKMRNSQLETGGKATLFKSQECNCVDNVLVMSRRKNLQASLRFRGCAEGQDGSSDHLW